MAFYDLDRNTYEENPDKLKEVLEKGQINIGKFPELKNERSSLIKEHDRVVSVLAEGQLQSRTFILPMPYPPSNLATEQAKQVLIKDVAIRLRDPRTFLLLRTITLPYVYSSSTTVAEDESGSVARLTVCNIDDSPFDSILTKGIILIVKQPCWNIMPDGGYYIRVDHPSDLVIVSPDNDLVPDAWNIVEKEYDQMTCEKLKKEGDSMFLEKRFRKAKDMYERGLKLLKGSNDTAALMDMYRKLCGVNIVLLRFDDAAAFLAQAIALHYNTSDTSQNHQLGNAAIIESWLHDRSLEDPLQVAIGLPRALRDLATRIKFDIGVYTTTPRYDFAKLSRYVGPFSLHVDAETYISDTEIRQTASHGRGLFAKREFKSGDLIMAEKAFALPGHLLNDSSTECSLYNLGDGTATDRYGALLFRELVQKLDANPSLRKDFFSMDDGGYWAKHGWELSENETIPVDVFRIDAIRRRNSFTAPLRALDVLTQPTSLRNGFWIHTSYINHSCLPNSARTFMGDVLILRATRSISAGEEITAQYITPELSFAARQKSYMDTWGFECDCALCTAEAKVGANVEAQRSRIFEELKGMAQRIGGSPSITALRKFSKRLRDLEALYDDEIYTDLPKLSLVHPTLFLTEAWRGVKRVDKMIECGMKLLENFGIEVRADESEFTVVRNSGLVNVECVRVLKYLADGYIEKGEAEVAASILETAKVWFRVITGADVGSEELLGD